MAKTGTFAASECRVSGALGRSPAGTTRRLRVALLASTCDGQDVGESWSSFQWANGLSRQCDLTVLTYSRPGHLPTIQQLEHARVIEWPDAPLLSRFERFSAGAKPGWWLLYWRARRWLKAAIRRGEKFDLIHQVSPLALRHACPAAGLGVPYIVGPLAGSLKTPEAFRGEVGAEPWYNKMRALDTWRFRHDPLLRRGLRDASVVIGVAPYVAELLRDIPLQRFEVIAETGVHQLPVLPERPAHRQGPVKLLYVGRIVRTKGLRDALRALALLPQTCPVHLDVLGDGDDRRACETEADELGVRSRVSFHGKVPRQRVNDFYREADVFLFPSFREPSGNVVFEAMSFGLPLIVAASGGPAHVVSEECGYRIPPSNPKTFALDIAYAIEELLADPTKRTSMGLASRRRVESLALWQNKIDWMLDLYQDLATQNKHD